MAGSMALDGDATDADAVAAGVVARASGVDMDDARPPTTTTTTTARSTMDDYEADDSFMDDDDEEAEAEEDTDDMRSTTHEEDVAADGQDEAEEEEEEEELMMGGDQKRAFPPPPPPPLSCDTYDIIPHALVPQATHTHAVAASHDFRWVYTAGADGWLRRYDFFASMRGASMLTLSQRHGLVETVTKGAVLLSAWPNEATPSPVGTPLKQLQAVGVHSLAVQREAVWALIGAEDGVVRLASLRVHEGSVQARLKEHSGPVSALHLYRRETAALSGSWDKHIVAWDLNHGGTMRTFRKHTSQISAIVVAPSCAPSSLDAQASTATAPTASPLFLSSGVDGRAYLWDVRQREPVRALIEEAAGRAARPWILSSCWHPDGTKIYCGRRNGTLDEWDVVGGKLNRRLRHPVDSGAVSFVTCMGNGRQLLAASFDNLRLWNLTADEKSHAPFQIIPGHHGEVISQVLVDEQCRYMVSVSGNRGWEGTIQRHGFFYEIVPVMNE